MKPVLRWILLVVACYCLFYVACSANGAYSARPYTKRTYEPSTGGLRFAVGTRWHPRFGEHREFQVLYSPLLFVDRLIWHPTLDISNPEDKKMIELLSEKGELKKSDNP